jgi:predicted nucleic acid-binding Zn ribbon protein
MMAEPERVGSILERLAARMGITSRLEKEKAVVLWEEVVGETAARRAEAVSIKGGRLVVVVESSAWVQQLALLKEGIIAKINSRIGKPVVEDIIFRIGEIGKEKSNGG